VQYCVDGSCANSLPVDDCDLDGFKALSNECACGSKNCKAGTFCFEIAGKEKCSKYPQCPEDEKITDKVCVCGKKGCKKGKFCHEGKCVNEIPKDDECECLGIKNRNGIGDTCEKTAENKPYMWCNVNRKACLAAGMKVHGGPKAGKIVYGWSPDLCPETEDCKGGLIDMTCKCGRNTCNTGKYCVDNKCTTDPPMEKCEQGADSLEAECMCGKQKCPAGKYCQKNKCVDEPEKECWKAAPEIKIKEGKRYRSCAKGRNRVFDGGGVALEACKLHKNCVKLYKKKQ
jgi:hypothetical protein